MDRGLKERLVGAAVLVAIGAWLIPWVLDGPEQLDAPERETLQLPAPTAEEPPVRTETIVLDRRDSPLPSEAGEAGTAGEAASEPAPAEPPSAAATAPPAPEPEPEPEATAATAEPAPAEPAAEDTADGEAAATRWYVQLGAFGDRANADRLAARVETYGYDARVSGFPAGAPAVHRVRVGPEPTRARAEAIASALSAHGFVAQVVFE